MWYSRREFGSLATSAGIGVVMLLLLLSSHLAFWDPSAINAKGPDPTPTLSPTESVEISRSQQAIVSGDLILGRLNKNPQDIGMATASALDDPKMDRIWEIEYGPDVLMRISPETGELLFFIDYALCTELLSEDMTSMNQTDSTDQAREYLEDLDISVPSDQEPRITFMPGFNAYEVYFPRMLDGYPFESDFVLLDLAAGDGRLLSFHKAYYSALCKTDVELTEDQAHKIAAAFVAQHGELLGFEIGKSSSELRIVQPNCYWTPGCEQEYEGASRLAYVVTLWNADELMFPELVVLWIDSESGEMLGGTRSN